MTKNYLYMSIDTTGLNPSKDSVIRVMALLTSSESRKAIDLKIKPKKGTLPSQLDPEALAYSGYDVEQLRQFYDVDVALGALCNFLETYCKGSILVCHSFDFLQPFLKSFFEYSGYPEYRLSDYTAKHIDLCTLYKQLAFNGTFEELNNYKLITILKQFLPACNADKLSIEQRLSALVKIHGVIVDKLNKGCHD